MTQFKRGAKRVSPKKKKVYGFYLAVLGGVILMVTAMIWVNSQRAGMIEVGYDINTLRSENHLLREQQTALRAELNRLQRPDLIVSKAVALGLRPVHSERRIAVLGDGAPNPAAVVAELNEE